MIKSLLCLILSFVLGLSSCSNSNKTADVIALNFPSYDAARAILKDEASLQLLLPPGSEIHHYEPTAKDMIAISNAKLVIYTGGESDSWVENILESIDSEVRTFRLIDAVELVEMEEKEGMSIKEDGHGHHHEMDEHVWTSPINEISIVKALALELESIYPDKVSILEANANEYIGEIEMLDTEIRSVVDSSRHNTLIFGSRFPLRYFVDEYGLDYFAAFPGCSEQTEPSASTIAFLIDKAKELGIGYVLDIEFGSPMIVKTIAGETNAETRIFNSMHNVSARDFEAGETYVSLMRRNLEILKEVLN